MTTSEQGGGGESSTRAGRLLGLGLALVGFGGLMLSVAVDSGDVRADPVPSSSPVPVLAPPLPPLPAPIPLPPPKLVNARLRESSGLVRSRAHEGVYWTHNDSGGKPELFAIGAAGEDLGVVPVTGVDKAVDWESIAADDQGFLYIGDTGNNRNGRKDLSVLVGREPDPRLEGAELRVERRLRFRYPGRERIPDPDELNYDSEALFWADGALFLLTKHRSDTRTVLFRFPSGIGTDEVELERLGEFDVGGAGAPYPGMVTGAAVAPDGRALALLTYHGLLLFERPGEGEHWLSRPLRTIGFDPAVTIQCEGVAWDSDGILFTNEERGDGNRVFRLRDPLNPAWVRFPRGEGG